MNKKKILIVEDESITALFIKEELQNSGYEVVGTLRSGEETLENFQTLDPDLILMDIILDGKMDGIEASHKIREKKDLPIVYLTANSDQKTIDRAKLTGPFAYLLKPFQEIELKVALEMAFYKFEVDEKLKASERRFRNLVFNASDVILLLDQEGNIDYGSPAFERITGFPLDNLSPRQFFDLIDKQDFPVFKDYWNKILKHPEDDLRSEFKIITSSGHCIWLEAKARNALKDPDLKGVVLNLSDVSFRKEAQFAIEASRANIKALLDSSLQAYFLVDAKWNLIIFDQKAEEFTKTFYKKSMKEGDFLPQILSQDKDRAEELGEYLLKAYNKKVVKVNKAYQQGSTKQWFREKYTPAYNVQGEVFGVVLSLVDISEDVRREQELRDALQQKEVLLKEVYHRVKNNLAMVEGLLFLQKSLIEDEKYKEIFDECEKRIHSMALVHRNLYQSNDLVSIDVKNYIYELISHISSSFNYNKEVRINMDIQEVDFDLNRTIPLGLITNELITNAFKYAFDNHPKPELWITLHKKDKGFHYCVRDNGPGFTNAKEVGSSKTLGLNLVSMLGSDLRGKIDYQNVNGAKIEMYFE